MVSFLEQLVSLCIQFYFVIYLSASCRYYTIYDSETRDKLLEAYSDNVSLWRVKKSLTLSINIHGYFIVCVCVICQYLLMLQLQCLFSTSVLFHGWYLLMKNKSL